MGAKTDQVKGHLKQTAGVILGNEELEKQGKSDVRAGEAAEKVDQAKAKVDDVIDHAKDKVADAADSAKDALHQK
jgi:uncharacterized protein YjbJ (UPF0337 family)